MELADRHRSRLNLPIELGKAGKLLLHHGVLILVFLPSFLELYLHRRPLLRQLLHRRIGNDVRQRHERRRIRLHPLLLRRNSPRLGGRIGSIQGNEVRGSERRRLAAGRAAAGIQQASRTGIVDKRALGLFEVGP